MRDSHGSGALRRWSLTVATPLVVALCVTLLPATPASAASVDKRWAGYRIDAPGRAAGSWIGGYTISTGAKTYRINPEALPPSGGFGKEQRLTAAPGSTARNTRRAAWILSKYGAYRFRPQAAAVDAAVLHLLRGSKWRIFGSAGTRRIKQADQSDVVRSYARQMIESSARFAGPYEVDIRAQRPVVGRPMQVNVTVLSATGEPVPYLPVRVDVSGMESRAGRTGQRGTATLRWSTTSGTGAHSLRVMVRKVPYDRLLARKPGKGSWLAVAGRKRALVRQASLFVRARPRATVDPKGYRHAGGSTYPARVTVRGSLRSMERSARLTLYGPFPTAAARRCSGPTVASFGIRTRGNGTWTGPKIRLGMRGYYAWKVQLPHDDWNGAVSRCGPNLVGRSQSRLAIDSNRARIRLGAKVGAALTAANVSPTYAGKAKVVLYGPFRSRDAISCRPGKIVGTRWPAVSGSGRYAVPALKPPAVGYYGWRAQLPDGDLTSGSRTRCGPVDGIVRVVRR
jgi:hypothetical protein